MDATRISDGELVVLKQFSRADDPYEKEISAFLGSEPIVSHPKNHSVPIYDILDVPGEEKSILVMPFLDTFREPPFETVGEVLEFLRQVFEVR